MKVRIPFRPKVVASVAGIMIAGAAAPATAQRALAVAQESNREFSSWFGADVALDGSTAIIGAMRDDEVVHSAGAVFMYRWDGATWARTAKLVAEDGGRSHRFGAAVDIDGDLAVVQAPFWGRSKSTTAGATYFFRRHDDGWRQEAQLVATFATGDIAIDGDVAVVSSRIEGIAVVYRDGGDGWAVEAKLESEELAKMPWVPPGGPVAVDGNVVVVGVPQAGPYSSGLAFVFRYDRVRSAWSPEATLPAGEDRPQDFFGTAVAIEGSRIAVGAVEGCDCADQREPRLPGSTYVFRRAGGEWRLEARLRASDGTPEGRFGTSVSLSGDRLMACASRG